MPIIKTTNDWWRVVDDNWPDLLNILYEYLPKDNFVDATAAKENRDWETLHHAFNTAWFNAPDNIGIHEIPGWGCLCDLCSEIWVFDKVEA